jgi:hypothetical protein
MIRPRTQLAAKSPEDYLSADDALAAAAKLDMLGDWEESMNLYRYSAERWPEQEGYANECIKVIAAKKANAANP